MKLTRVGAPGIERPVLIDDNGKFRDLSGVVADIAGDVLNHKGLDKLRALDITTLPLMPQDSRIGPAVGQVGKVICVGLNFPDHSNAPAPPLPDTPLLFI